MALSLCGIFVVLGRCVTHMCTSYLAKHNIVDAATNTVAGAVIRAQEKAEVAIDAKTDTLRVGNCYLHNMTGAIEEDGAIGAIMEAGEAVRAGIQEEWKRGGDAKIAKS